MKNKIEITSNLINTLPEEKLQDDVIDKPEIANLVENDEEFLVKTKGTLRVATYNILTSFSYRPKDNDTPESYHRSWAFRKHLIVEMINKLDPDILGLQEVSIEQFDFLKENLPNFGWVGFAAYTGHALNEIEKDEYVGEIVPILYNKETVSYLDSNVFWLSETPDKLSTGWDASRPRILTAAAFRIKAESVKIVVGNAHYDHLGGLVNSGIVEGTQLEKYREQHQASDAIYLGDRNCFTDRGRAGNTWYKIIKELSRAEDTRLCGNHVGSASTFIGFEKDEFKAPCNPITKQFEPQGNTLDLIFHKQAHYKTVSSKNASGEYEVKEGVAHLLPFFGKLKDPEKRNFTSDHTCLVADFVSL